jgi:DNA-binding response OmpR family regulator
MKDKSMRQGRGTNLIKILIVENEKPISDLLRMSLTKAGYDCTCAYDGLVAADILENGRFDLILLDIMLPGANGYELMEYIQPMEMPVIFLTAKGMVEDKVRGLRMGADDYIVKPFEIIEMLARVETVLRRYHKLERMIEIAGLSIDTRSMVVRRDGKEISLTRKEYDLLLLFARNPGTALYRDTIYDRVWGGDYFGDSRTIDLHVQRLRKKVGWEDKLQSVYKVGYRLEA